MTQPIDFGSLLLSDEKLNALVPFFTKDYGQEAFSFVKNHQRLLNYWSEGINLLPPQESEGKRRKFSFFDLVWLGIVLELRSYGMEKETIAVLKDELFAPYDYSEMLKMMKLKRQELEEAMRTTLKLTEVGARHMVDTILEKQGELQKSGFSMLALYVNYVIGKETPLKLLVSKEGHHKVLPMDVAESELPPVEEGAYANSYLTLSLDGIMRFYAALPLVTQSVKKAFLTEREQQLIEEVRREGVKSLTIRFQDGKMEQVESTTKKKVSIEARLTEVLIKGGYENLNIITENGCIVSVEQTQKKRFAGKA
jgi:DNA-binding transcriptional MerR regulator